mmetsp:Transcript_29418/g.69974  ORF Transcript_29418/g.69974 Transcript_29418/m.69974 type:complete len:329 (-) Transcript_29418:1815-2801(-)
MGSTPSSSIIISASAWAILSATAAALWPVASSVRSGLSSRTWRRVWMLPLHLVQRQFSREGTLTPPCCSTSKLMGMWETPPRCMEESNWAAMRCTSTCAVMPGESFAVASSSSCVIWSFFDVPFFPRIAWISSILFLTLSSVSTICSLTASFGLSSSSFFAFCSRTTLGFFPLSPTFSKPSSSLSSPVFIHLLMPVAPDTGPASLEDEESSFDQSESSSSSSSSSSLLAFFSALASFLGFSSSSLSLSLSALSLDSLSSSAPPSSSSSPWSGFSMYFSISFSYSALFFLMFCFIALRDFAFVLLIFFTFSLSLLVVSTSSASCTIVAI